jgi:hypothetical protein
MSDKMITGSVDAIDRLRDRIESIDFEALPEKFQTRVCIKLARLDFEVKHELKKL